MAEIRTKLDKLTTQDAYSLLLFALYKLKEVPSCSVTSELAYILDKDNLIKLIENFGGMTITIPKLRDLKLMSFCLLLYKLINIDGLQFDKAVKNLNLSADYPVKEIKDMYFTLCTVLDNYSFDRG